MISNRDGSHEADGSTAFGSTEAPVAEALTAEEPVSPECTPRELNGWYSVGFALNGFFAIQNFLPLLAQSCALVVSGFPGICQNVITDAARISLIFPPTKDHANVTSMYFLADFPGLECDVSQGVLSFCT